MGSEAANPNKHVLVKLVDGNGDDMADLGTSLADIRAAHNMFTTDVAEGCTAISASSITISFSAVPVQFFHFQLKEASGGVRFSKSGTATATSPLFESSNEWKTIRMTTPVTEITAYGEEGATGEIEWFAGR